jgi:hypothetical protein
MAEAGDEIAKSSMRLGVSAESLQEWRYAAKLSGIEAGEMSGALTILQRNLAGAASGGKEQADVFSKLKVKVKDAHGQIRTMDDLLPDIAEGISKLKNPTEKAGVAMKLFGRSGTQLLPLLNEGREGVAKLRAEFAELGGGMETETVKASEELNDEIDRLNVSVFSLKSRLAGILIPYLRIVVEAVRDGVTGFMKLAAGTHFLEAALITLGTVLTVFAAKTLIAFAPLIATAAAFALGIAFIVLVVDDLISLFTGGKSVIGDFLDELLGVGTAQQMVIDLRDAWEGMVKFIKDATIAVKDFLGLDLDAEEKAYSAKGNYESTPASIAENKRKQAAKLARQGIVSRMEGETWDEAKRRFELDRAYNYQGPRQANVGASGRPGRAVAVPAGGGAGTMVDARTTATIQIAPGTDQKQREDLRKVVGEVIDRRNRETAAALTMEAVPEG